MKITKNYRAAAFFSPILGLFGLSPLLLLQKLPVSEMATIFFVLTTGIFVFWTINLYLSKKLESSRPLVRIGFSYAVTLLVHLIFMAVAHMANGNITPVKGISVLYPFFSVIFINTFILVIIEVVKLQESRAEARIEIKKLSIANLEAQKQLLVQQLQPHFLFNSLSTLKALIREDAATAERYTLQLSEFMRYSTNASSENMISLADELDFAKGYLELQQYRFAQALSYSDTIGPHLFTAKIPVFALQLLVENAVKHNYFTKDNPICIELYSEEEMVCVRNKKTGLRVTGRSGHGLKNLNERLFLMTGKTIVKAESETEFIVKIPLEF